MEKLANTKNVKNVFDLLNKHDIDVVDIAPSYMDIITTINDAMSDRVAKLQIAKLHGDDETINDIQNDIDHLAEWKINGLKYVYIDSDIYYLNGKCCKVYESDLKYFKSRVLKTIKENN